MRFTSLSLFGLYGLLSTSVVTLVRGDTDFMSIQKNVAKDYKSEGSIPMAKYFNTLAESSFHCHYDGRFANETLSDKFVTPHLSTLIQTYLTTISSIGAETWILHGTLLAWWWNRKICPWDNPNYIVRSEKDRLDVIDIRWIDMSSGLFIGITVVRKDEEARKRGRQEALMCKDKHHYEESQIFPLRDSYFEDVPVKIPYAYTELLVEEYGSKSLTKTEFQGCAPCVQFVFGSLRQIMTENTKIWDTVKPKLKRFLQRNWGANDLPIRAPGVES